MVGLFGCGGSKIANEYYEFDDWLNENIEFKEDTGIIGALGIQGAASILAMDINAKTTLTLYSEKKLM